MVNRPVVLAYLNGCGTTHFLRHLANVAAEPGAQSKPTRVNVQHQMYRIGLLALLGAVALSACSPPADTLGGATPSLSSTTSSTPLSTTSSLAASTSSSLDEPTVVSDDVIRPGDNDGGDDDDQVWIGTASMTDNAIELAWDLADNASRDVSHRLYRLPTAALAEAGWDDPEEAVLSGNELLFEIPTDVTGYTDSEVEAGIFYTYFLIGLVDPEGAAEVVTRRWTTGLARTDTEAPTAIEGLEAEVTADGVLLTWEPSTDDVEFGSYAVSIVGDGGALTYLGGGADASLVKFLDDRPHDGSTTYLVEAVDFHNNRSTPATITVDGP